MTAGKMNDRRAFWCVVLLLTIACTSSGCAKWHNPLTSPDVRPLREKRMQDAVVNFEQRRNDAQFEAARSFYRQGNFDACQQQLDSLLLRAPDHGEALRLKIETLLQRGELEQAGQVAAAAVERHADDPALVEMQGRAFEAVGREPQALAAFERAAHLKHRAEPATRQSSTTKPTLANAGDTIKPATRAGLLKAETALALGQYEHATAQALAVVDEAPEVAAARHQAGRALEAAGHLPEAAEQYARAAELSPHDTLFVECAERVAGRLEPALRVAEAPSQEALSQDEREPRARDVSQTTVTIGPDDGKPESKAAGALRRAEAALASGAPNSAQRLLTDAVRAAPRDEAVALQAAVLALRHEQPELAVEVAQLALQTQPRSAALYRTLGTARYRLADYSAARSALERSLDLDKSQPLSHYLLAATLEKLGQVEPAEEHYRRARAIDGRYKR